MPSAAELWGFGQAVAAVAVAAFEASYADLYSDVWRYADWAKEIGVPPLGFSGKDTGIDLVAKSRGRAEYHAIQCVTTTDDWTANAESALSNQQPPVFKIDWAKFQSSAPPTLKPNYALRPHQVSARADVVRGLQTADRGRLIMACGTGETLTSLKIAEEVAGKNKLVLFLVPSLNLLSQTLTEWTGSTDRFRPNVEWVDRLQGRSQTQR